MFANISLGKISISEGNIKVGHLDAVPLFRIHRDEYKFSLSFEGKVKKIDDDLIQMNYSDDNIKKRKW